MTSEHLYLCLNLKCPVKGNHTYSFELLFVQVPLLLHLAIIVANFTVLLRQVMIQMHLQTRVFLLIVPIEIHVHPSVKEPTVWQLLSLNPCLDRLDFFLFQIFNLSQSFFWFRSSSTITKHIFDNRFCSFRSVSSIDQKS